MLNLYVRTLRKYPLGMACITAILIAQGVALATFYPHAHAIRGTWYGPQEAAKPNGYKSCTFKRNPDTCQAVRPGDPGYDVDCVTVANGRIGKAYTLVPPGVPCPTTITDDMYDDSVRVTGAYSTDR